MPELLTPFGRRPVEELNTRDELERALTLCREQWMHAKRMDPCEFLRWSEASQQEFRRMVIALEARGKALREKLETLK